MNIVFDELWLRRWLWWPLTVKWYVIFTVRLGTKDTWDHGRTGLKRYDWWISSLLTNKIYSNLLTLKRLRGVNLTTSPPLLLVVFRKMYLLKRGSNPGFLWLLILSYNTSFLKVLLNFLKSFRRYEEIFCQY